MKPAAGNDTESTTMDVPSDVWAENVTEALVGSSVLSLPHAATVNASARPAIRFRFVSSRCSRLGSCDSEIRLQDVPPNDVMLSR